MWLNEGRLYRSGRDRNNSIKKYCGEVYVGGMINQIENKNVGTGLASARATARVAPTKIIYVEKRRRNNEKNKRE
jgi:hypothetical protein